MKASIKFANTQKSNVNGFPVYKILRSAGKSPMSETMFRCLPEFWNDKDKVIIKAHPDYDFLIADLLNVKSVIKAINLGLYSYDVAVEKLFGGCKIESDVFYDACRVLMNGTSTGNLYETVLNSFNIVFPGVRFAEITDRSAKTYMDAILKYQKPNGVHTYMRTLDAAFKKVCDLPSPFKGVRPKMEDTPDKDLTVEDLRRIFTTRTVKNKYDGRNTNESVNYYRYYYMLLFFLGGIDMFDLAQLRYDKHVVNGRIQFRRGKGGTTSFVNNKLFPVAMSILDKFDCYPYLVPIKYKNKNHKEFVSNMNAALKVSLLDLKLSRYPLTKSARYSFINIAQDLLIDERITAQLVGHKNKSTTGIYTRNFALPVIDEAHEKIISNL